MSNPCLICERPVPDYEPQYCCSGIDCACAGQPTEPCVCSERCCDALFSHIGKTYEDRRIAAGIEKYNTMTTPTPTPRTDAARNQSLQWHAKHGHERLPEEVLHTMETDPRPDNGWDVARELARENAELLTIALHTFVTDPDRDRMCKQCGHYLTHITHRRA